eukprot:GILK01007328.1.p1 GENE.GILK01007328.1~~GILK01007328.1.p1  ORF type:complete len:294 (+),score=30.76 GILK01007328.1:60-884(+)
MAETQLVLHHEVFAGIDKHGKETLKKNGITTPTQIASLSSDSKTKDMLAETLQPGTFTRVLAISHSLARWLLQPPKAITDVQEYCPDQYELLSRDLHSLYKKYSPLQVPNGFTPPSCFDCPVSLQFMADPVIIHPSGMTYDISSVKVLVAMNKGKTILDPKTNVKIERISINLFVRQLFEDMVQQFKKTQMLAGPCIDESLKPPINCALTVVPVEPEIVPCYKPLDRMELSKYKELMNMINDPREDDDKSNGDSDSSEYRWDSDDVHRRGFYWI